LLRIHHVVKDPLTHNYEKGKRDMTNRLGHFYKKMAIFQNGMYEIRANKKAHRRCYERKSFRHEET
jgi:hypothetical protein